MPSGFDAFGDPDAASAPATRAVPVTPDDNANLPEGSCKALYVGVAGDIKMIGAKAASGSPGAVWQAVPAGSILPFRARRILATGTTASGILALYD